MNFVVTSRTVTGLSVTGWCSTYTGPYSLPLIMLSLRNDTYLPEFKRDDILIDKQEAKQQELLVTRDGWRAMRWGGVR